MNKTLKENFLNIKFVKEFMWSRKLLIFSLKRDSKIKKYKQTDKAILRNQVLKKSKFFIQKKRVTVN